MKCREVAPLCVCGGENNTELAIAGVDELQVTRNVAACQSGLRCSGIEEWSSGVKLSD